MKTTVSFNEFCNTFRNHGRQDSFSYEGKKALFDYLEELEEDCAMDIELDVIALDCEYCEYGNAIEAAREYGCDYYSNLYNEDDSDNEDCEEETEAYCVDWLSERTQVIGFSGGIIIRGF